MSRIQAPPVWITRHPEGWQVKREGADRASAITDTQAAAIDIGHGIAQHQRTEIYVTGRNGQIRERNSFGHDPASRRG